MKFKYSLPHLGQTDGTFCGVVAVVAKHAAVAPVIGQRDGAIDALQPLAAGAARNEARKSAAVEQQHGLLAALQTLGDGLHQPPRKCRLLARLQKLLPHVDHFDVRHGPLLDAFRQLDQGVLAALGVVAALETRRGRTQHHHRAGFARAHDGDIAAVIARRFLLLVARVVLFVDHHQPQVLHRREHARARAHHHRRKACANSPPLLGALGVMEGGVQNGHAIAKALEELAGHRGRQRDLRHQQQRAAAQRYRGVNRLQVHLGFPRPRDALQQKGVKLTAAQRGFNLLVSFQLMWIERARRNIARKDARGRLRFQRDQVPARQRTRGLACALHRCLQLLQIMRARVQFQERVQLALALGQLQAFWCRADRELTQEMTRAAWWPMPAADRAALPNPPSRRSPSSQAIESRLSAFGNFFCRYAAESGRASSNLRICSVEIFVVGAQKQLPRRIAPSVGERIKLGLSNLATERRHAAQHFAQRRTVVLRDPAAQREQLGVENRLLVHQAQGLLNRPFRRIRSQREYHACQLPGSKRNQKPAAGLHPRLHRLGQPVGKRLIQRHRQANVAVHHELVYMKAEL